MQHAQRARGCGRSPIESKTKAAFDRHAAPFCAEQLRAPRLHALLSWPKLQPLIHGAKGVGSQGDGTAQLVCRSAATAAKAAALIETELEGMACMHLTLGRATPEEQAGAGMG